LNLSKIGRFQGKKKVLGQGEVGTVLPILLLVEGSVCGALGLRLKQQGEHKGRPLALALQER
jgi:hypothetical protein